MIEVFKTNVITPDDALFLVRSINAAFPAYCINFDLDDCDRILRVKYDHGLIESQAVIGIVESKGFSAEILDGDVLMYGNVDVSMWLTSDTSGRKSYAFFI